MAAQARLLPFIFSTWLASNLVVTASASPVYSLYPRNDLVKAPNGTWFVLDSENQFVNQGAATDGGGQGFSPPAIIWLVFSLAIGIPLSLAGIRLWRFTTGASIGIAATVCIWAAFVNTVGAPGISDIVLTCIIIGAFVVGFIVGVLNLGLKAGVMLLGVSGGFSIGVRIVLFRSGLLIPDYAANWVFPGILAAVGFVLAVARQRAAILIGSASVGTFLTALGIDLIINKQNGMSFGLRFLFDRNDAHLVELITEGYHPPISTLIIMAVSLALTPLLAYGQNKIFSNPFKPPRTPTILLTISDGPEGEIPSITVDETTPIAPPPESEKEREHRTSDDASLAKSTDKLVSVAIKSS